MVSMIQVKENHKWPLGYTQALATENSITVSAMALKGG